MQLKLQYLENKILGRKVLIEDYKELPEYELESLEHCDTNSQNILFASIVKCLIGKDLIIYINDEKAYIKKDETFSIWKKCYIHCDSLILTIKKKTNKNYYEFNLANLKVSKKYLEYKGKVCFGLMFQSKKYMLGFEQETACERIFKTIRQLARENNPNQKLNVS